MKSKKGDKKCQKTEQQILNAAKQVFLLKGLDGARMQEIADKANINKALLHYYFRSKEKLFLGIFNEAFVTFLPNIKDLLTSNETLFKKIEIFVSQYIDLMKKNPYLPIFILREMQRAPEIINNLYNEIGIIPELFIKQINTEIKKGTIKKINPQQLLVNIISLCIFPFAGRPIIQRMIFANNEAKFDKFVEQRKKEIPKFIINAISSN